MTVRPSARRFIAIVIFMVATLIISKVYSERIGGERSRVDAEVKALIKQKEEITAEIEALEKRKKEIDAAVKINPPLKRQSLTRLNPWQRIQA